MNPVLILTHNNLLLTRRSFVSVACQDIATSPFIFDNGSSDGTAEWLSELGIDCVVLPENTGVSHGWNSGLSIAFEEGAKHVLCVGNDTWLAPWVYSELLSYDVPFVTGVAVDNMEQANQRPDRVPLTQNPDFSCFLIRRDCWEKVGPFDERMKHYCSDCDFHVRAHRMGIPLYKASVAYYHERSSTLNNAPPKERIEIQEQANRDREVFRSIYGCLPGTMNYDLLFAIPAGTLSSR